MADQDSTESAPSYEDSEGAEIERQLLAEKEKLEGTRMEFDVPHGVAPGSGTVAIHNKKEGKT